MRTRPWLVATLALVVVALLALLALVHEPLLPWLPWKPGYVAHRSAAGTVYLPRYLPHRPRALALDSAVRSVEATHGLRFTKPVRVFVTTEWSQFSRGALIDWRGRPTPVLGAALQTGDVVYLSPLGIDQPRPETVLAHELSHALLYQHVSLRESFALRGERWLLEGFAVHFGNPGAYLSDAAFDSLVARHPEWAFSPVTGPSAADVPAELAGPVMLTRHRRFVQWLIERYGHDLLQALVREVVRTPRDAKGAFARVYGLTLPDAGARYLTELRGRATAAR